MISLDNCKLPGPGPGSGTGIGLAAIAMGTTRRRVSKAVSFRIDCSIVKFGCGSLAVQLKFGVTLQSIKEKIKNIHPEVYINQSMSNLNFSKGKMGSSSRSKSSAKTNNKEDGGYAGQENRHEGEEATTGAFRRKCLHVPFFSPLLSLGEGWIQQWVATTICALLTMCGYRYGVGGMDSQVGRNARWC